MTVKKRILCLVPGIERPSTRYRLLQYMPYMRSAGIEADVHTVPRGVKRWALLSGAGRYRGVFLQKKLLSRMELLFLRGRAGRIIYDFDDAVMYTAVNYSQKTRRYKRFAAAVKEADFLIAGNRYLASFAPGEKTDVIPTVLDTSAYAVRRRRDGRFVIGWIGTKSTQPYAKNIVPAVRNILKKYPSARAVFISDKKPDFCEERIMWKLWDKDKEAGMISGFDVGIMPLPENPWTNGKCGFKLIQYMAAGLPVVCSPVGANTDIIQDNVNGFFASSAQEWEECIRRLIDGPALYERMSAAGRKRAETEYCLTKWGPYFSERIKKWII